MYKKWLSFTLISLALAVLVYAVNDILLPFLFAIFISYIASPLMHKLSKFGIGRGVSAISIVSIMCIIIGAALYILGPIIYKQLLSIIELIPKYKAYLQTDILPNALAKIEKLDKDLVSKVHGTLQESSASILVYFSRTIQSLLTSGGTIISTLSLVFIAPLAMFYLLRDWPTFTKYIQRMLPIPQTTSTQIFSQIDQVLSLYIRGQFNVSMILFFYYLIALSLANLDFAIVLAILTALLNFIPIFGFLIAFVTASILTILQFGSLHSVWTILAIYCIGNILEGNFLTPKLIGDRLGLHPLAIMFIMLASANLYGFWGMLVAVPSVAVCFTLLNFILKNYINNDVHD
jgi:predicted PurR-regulated permease PerM